jgi:hypothetical protein
MSVGKILLKQDMNNDASARSRRLSHCNFIVAAHACVAVCSCQVGLRCIAAKCISQAAQGNKQPLPCPARHQSEARQA